MLSKPVINFIFKEKIKYVILFFIIVFAVVFYLDIGKDTVTAEGEDKTLRIAIPYVGTEPNIDGYEYIYDFTRSYGEYFDFDVEIEYITGKTKSEMLRNLNLALLNKQTRPDFLYYCLNSNYLDLDDLYDKGIIVGFPEDYTVRSGSVEGLKRYNLYQPIMLSGFAVNLGKQDDELYEFLAERDILDLNAFYEYENLSSKISPLELNGMSLEIETLLSFSNTFNHNLDGGFKLKTDMVEKIDEGIFSEELLTERYRIREKFNLDRNTSYFDNIEIIKNNRVIYDHFDPLNPKYTSELMSKKSSEEINLKNVDIGSTYLTLRTWGLIKVAGREEVENEKLYLAESIGNNEYNERLYYNRGYVPACSDFLDAMFEKTAKSISSNSKLCTDLALNEIDNINNSDGKYYYLGSNELTCYEEYKEMLLRCYLSDDSYDKGKIETDITNFKNKMKLLLGE